MSIQFASLYPFLFILARFGPAFSMLPGIKGVFVPGRIKLLLSLSITFLVAGPLASKIPPMPKSDIQLILLLAQEAIIGVFIGLLIRLIFYTLEIAGQLFSFQSGFASAQLFNPGIEGQTGVIATFCIMVGIVLIFTTDLYQIILRNIINSYELFSVQDALPVGDFAQTIILFVNSSFNQAVQLAMPIFIIITLFFIAMGLMSKFIPGVQIFFISLPVQIMIGLLIFFLTLTGFFEVYLQYFSDQLTYFPQHPS